ncbi:MAG: ShlB/FhaC/HecB family hemolysin secretion/activation protein, partial [Leptolyngbya sp. SIO1D8]|nr:ShlB/FhaC/HecB family hemolysin secretion/activation protein [Leptolyngbya sp. SIO1D8]
METAQALPPPQDLIQPPRPELPDTDLPTEAEPVLPPLSDEVPQVEFPDNILDQIPETFAIREIGFEGNTAFSTEQLITVLQTEIETELFTETGNLTDLLRIVTIINRHYQQAGYITTGALLPIPPEDGFPEGRVIVPIVEGRVTDIQVTGTQQLRADYVRSRLALGTQVPLQRGEIVDALQLLQEDPLIEHIQATLTAGEDFGTNILQVQIQEAPSFQTGLSLNNVRTPNVGTLQVGLSLSERNLSGHGDRFDFTY